MDSLVAVRERVVEESMGVRESRQSPKRKRPAFTRADYMIESKILHAAAAIMDGRSSQAKLYVKLSRMLTFADVHMPKGLPR